MSHTRVTRLLARSAARHTGLVVGVWTGGDGVSIWQRGQLPAGPNSIFEIGSITKVFTATLLADMAETGLVALDDPLERHLPAAASMPTRGRSTTLADLASHRSGLPHVPAPLLLRGLTTERRDPYARWDAARVEAQLARTRPRSAPGQRFQYSNWGVGLLGHALALRAGMSFGELVQTRICRPLGMSATGIEVDGGRLATGHTRRGRPTPHWDLAALAGAGGLRSSAADLLAFLRLHAGDSPSETLALAARETQRERIAHGRGHVGLGWLILPPGRWLPHRLLVHEGATGGFRAFAVLAPELRAGVVVLANQARSVSLLGLRVLRAAAAGKVRC
jgi:CubicO group peptidase (beta-lactamase class C family)